ncbi:TPA: hypothetical protein NGU71_004485 [Vibrio parahaemolyticus]|uniref:hypothetical protein n=1 Tax=Vibrio parahaemolyticus TaxID=670 RepID=UPI00186993C2|nr:hypothetical protein [Vibrio parahaemolyticus]MBE4053456.1 hypothetical protein [Vibrio parahaemolyticus]HCE4755661.1 hypothetical protein [Vibrio parahaemolyticus]HCH2726842.1 hypothetical protein [Vibrio parahaemolyticus]HCM0804196.1 hypothetical protein [Vibrio parahaemolyticus]
MKISTLIDKLEEFKRKSGNIDVYVRSPYENKETRPISYISEFNESNIKSEGDGMRVYMLDGEVDNGIKYIVLDCNPNLPSKNKGNKSGSGRGNI